MTDAKVAALVGCTVDAARVARRKRGAKAHRSNPHWTDREEALLRWSWGHASAAAIARTLGRTPGAVTARAGSMHLGVADRGKLTLAEAVRQTGWNRDALLRAAKYLGLSVSRHPHTLLRARKYAWLLLDEDEARRAADWLQDHAWEHQGPYERRLADEDVVAVLPATSREVAGKLGVGYHHARQALQRVRDKGLAKHEDKRWVPGST